MNLVLDARMINHSGIGVYLKNIIPQILDQYKVTLLGNPQILTELFKNASILPFVSDIYTIAEQIEYYKVIPKCDLFWSPHYNVPLFTVKAKKRVVTIHDVYHLAFYNSLNFKQKIYAKSVMKKAISASNEIITVSEFSKNEIINRTDCPSSKIHYIHNGVKPTTSLKSIEQIRKKYKLPLQYILFVGNVKPHKNLGLLLKAYLLLNDAIRDQYKIVIVGKKEGLITKDNDLLRLINTNSILSTNTIFTGYVADDEMDTIYANAATFVFPSLYEGFGLPPLEAMLNQCAVIVSQIPSLTEVCGDAALYCNVLNEQQLAEQITKILTNNYLRTRLINKGIERVKLFTWEQSIQQHIQLLNNIL